MFLHLSLINAHLSQNHLFDYIRFMFLQTWRQNLYHCYHIRTCIWCNIWSLEIKQHSTRNIGIKLRDSGGTVRVNHTQKIIMQSFSHFRGKALYDNLLWREKGFIDINVCQQSFSFVWLWNFTGHRLSPWSAIRHIGWKRRKSIYISELACHINRKTPYLFKTKVNIRRSHRFRSIGVRKIKFSL